MRDSVVVDKSLKSGSRYVRLLREASNYESLLKHNLDNLKSTDGSNKTIELLDHVLATFKDVIMLDPALAHKDKAPERLYRSTIPCLTAYLRPGCVKRSKEFDFFFNKITSCYQFLLLSLYRKTDDIYKATAENFKSYIDNSNNTRLGPVLRLMHDCFISLGDIMRTIALEQKADKDAAMIMYDLALNNYRKAWTIYYGSAIPSALMANVNRALNNDIDSLYWFTLSLGSSFTPQWAKTDLVTFLGNRVLSGVRAESEYALVSHDLMDFVLNAINAVDKQVTNYVDALLEICDRLSPNFYRCLPDRAASDSKSKYGFSCKETKVIAILNCLFYYLSKIFAKSEHPSKRQRIRLVQVLITLVLLKLLDHMFSLIISESSDQPDDKGQEYSTEDGSPQLIRDSVLWEPLSLACFCLSIDNSQVKVFKEYSKELPDVSKRISKIVVDFCKILSRVANEAMYSYNVDAPQELVPEDAITLGLKQTAVHYKEYSAQKLKQFFENIYSTTERVFDIRISRVVHLAKFFSVSFPDILVFSEDSEYEKFTVFDDIKKEIEATKLMKALAAERLRNQVRSLKGIYKRIKPNVPTAVLAADCYTENLSLVKNWVNSKSCTIIVPLCVIGDIDILKKSGSKKVSSSNEASRYLETLMRRKTEYIRPQRAGEQTIVWDYAGRIRNSNIVVPKSLREMMSVCLYYKNLISFMPGQEKRNTFFVVTDSTRILNTAEDLGIRGYRPNGWSRFLEKSACAHDNRPCTPNNK